MKCFQIQSRAKYWMLQREFFRHLRSSHLRQLKLTGWTHYVWPPSNTLLVSARKKSTWLVTSPLACLLEREKMWLTCWPLIFPLTHLSVTALPCVARVATSQSTHVIVATFVELFLEHGDLSLNTTSLIRKGSWIRWTMSLVSVNNPKEGEGSWCPKVVGQFSPGFQREDMWNISKHSLSLHSRNWLTAWSGWLSIFT